MLPIGLDSTFTIAPALPATATIETPAEGGHGQHSWSVIVHSVGLRGMVIEGDAALEGCRHAWVEVTLPDGRTIRPLVEVGRADEGRVPARFHHVFPRDRQVLEAFHAASATPAGY